MVYRITLIAVAVLLTACSDPKAANEKNFKIAIQKRLDQAYPTCYINANFPATLSEHDPYRNKSAFKALAAAGLLSEKEESKEVKEWGRTRTVVGSVFNLTEEGKKFYQPDAIKNNGLGEAVGGFCFGKATVKEITEFTEPADAMGARASQVSYTYEVSELPAWAKLPETIAAITKLKPDVASDKMPIKSRDVLVLTNNGWKSQLGGMLR